jgi:hypothetical protein
MIINQGNSKPCSGLTNECFQITFQLIYIPFEVTIYQRCLLLSLGEDILLVQYNSMFDGKETV